METTIFYSVADMESENAGNLSPGISVLETTPKKSPLTFLPFVGGLAGASFIIALRKRR